MINAFIYIGIFLGVFLSLLIIGKPKKEAHDWILVTWLLICAVELFFFFYDFNYQSRQFEAVQITGMLLPFATAPLLYFYVCALVRNRKFRLRPYLYHFIPFVFMATGMLYLYFNLGPDQSLRVDEGFIQTYGIDSFYVRNYGLILAFFSFLYPAISLYLLFIHKRRIQHEFSNMEAVNMNWLRYWIILSMIGFWISFIAIWSGSFRWVEFTTSFQSVATLITLNIAIIGFFGLKQTTIFTHVSLVEATVEQPKTKYASSGISAEASKGTLTRIDDYMQNEKPYLDSELNILKLAEKLGINKNQISQAINEQLGVNFFTYVNQYRIEHFKRLCQEPKNNNYTLLGLALEAGFNSKSSFNHVFKKLEGTTPGEFKKSLEQVRT